MAVVAIVAADCAITQAFFTNPGDRSSLYILGLLPMSNVLMFVMLSMSRDLLRRRESRPFMTGFVAAGWSAALIYSAFFCISNNIYIKYYLDTTLRPLVPFV